MYQYLYERSKEKAIHRVWILSDLQQSYPENARKCLDISMTDYESLKAPADMIWYLGDAVENTNLAHLKEMTAMQVQAFSKLGIPLCYATGNHDYDYARVHPDKEPIMPFYEAVKSHKNWFTTENCDDFYFTYKLGEYTIFFLCDHIAKDNKWLVTHNRIQKGQEHYPYSQKDADRLRETIAAVKGPVITASHYSFPGGSRENNFTGKLLPLPNNVKIHFYGHAHIGDLQWARENVYRRISWVDWHDIPQINVSSFENIRGTACRSVFLHIYEDGAMGVFFRNHDIGQFTECYFPAKENLPQRLSDLK